MSLSTRISPVAQGIIREAFKDLECSLSTEDRKQLNNTTLEDVRHAAHQIENQLAARQSLRNMRRLMPLFTGLEYYSKTIEVLCNGTPYLPWLWAPIKLVLKIASDHVKAFEKIIEAYARIAESLTRFEYLDKTYAKNLDVQQTLAVFYGDILKFHKHAYEFVRRTGWELFFLTSWGRFQRRFDNIIADLKAHEDLVDKTANVIDISEARDMRQKLIHWRQETLDRLDNDEAEHTATQFLTIVGWLKLDESDQLKVFGSIESEATNGLETCGWILKQRKISAWMRCSHEVDFLLLHGHPGTGKSVLATKIASFVKCSKRSLVITHFCTYLYATSTDYEQILKSILIQLIQSHTDLVAHVYTELILEKKPANAQTLERLLRDLVRAASLVPSQISYIHIIIDGLDECSGEVQAKVLSILEQMVSRALLSGTTVCKVLLSTRMSQIIAKKSRFKQTVCLSDEKNNIDRAIRQYASMRLESCRSRLLQVGITDDDIKTVEHGIAAKADGMFLWARLVLDYLATNMFFSRDEILGVVDQLPRKLSEFYGQILTSITAHFDDRSIARMRSILGWVAFAKRPLRKVEFRSALAFITGDREASELPPQFIFEMCIPLIEERPDSTFAFIHVSVRDFLQSSDSNTILDRETALYEQGLASVTCLLSGFRVFQPSYAHQSRFLRVLKGLHAFHTYATEYWVEYALVIASSTNGLRIDSKFFLSSLELSEALKEIAIVPTTETDDRSALLDVRLAHLQEHDSLYKVAKELLLERQARYLPALESIDDIGTDITDVTSLRSLLFNYQNTIKALLSMRSYCAVSLQDFERFKQQSRSTAFTCRLRSCPRATMGFDNDELRLKHELSHRKIVCRVAGCQYPPFSSSKSLHEHHVKCHSENVVGLERTTIKKISISSQSKRQGLGGRLRYDISKRGETPRLGSNEGAFQRNLKTGVHEEVTFPNSSFSAELHSREDYLEMPKKRSLSRTQPMLRTSFWYSARPHIDTGDTHTSMTVNTSEVQNGVTEFEYLDGEADGLVTKPLSDATDGVPDHIQEDLSGNDLQQQFRNTMANSGVPAPANGVRPGIMPFNSQQPAGPLQAKQKPISTAEGIPNDLEQYDHIYCTNTDCPDASNMFLSVSDLLRHMEAKHAARWICQEPLRGKAPPDPYSLIQFNQCPTCMGQRQYSSFLDVAEHLWTVHVLDLAPLLAGSDPYERFVTNIVQDWILDVAQFIGENDIGEPHNISASIGESALGMRFRECYFCELSNSMGTVKQSNGFCGVTFSRGENNGYNTFPIGFVVVIADRTPRKLLLKTTINVGKRFRTSPDLGQQPLAISWTNPTSGSSRALGLGYESCRAMWSDIMFFLDYELHNLNHPEIVTAK